MSALPVRRRRPFSFRLRLMLIIVGLIVGIAMLEIALRLTGVSHPMPYAPDQFCGSRLQAGFSGYWTKEGRAQFHTNQLGFRDRDHATTKPARTKRIAVLGDSYIEALQVADDAIFSRQLEQYFAEHPLASDEAVEVLSFGISGWGTAEELLALRHYVWQFDPDVVVLAFLPANDVRNNSRDLEPMKCRPFFTLVDNKLVLDDSFLTDPDYLLANKASTQWKNSLINTSRVIQLILAVRDARREQPTTAGSATARAAAPEIEAGLVEAGMVAPETAEWNEAWQLTDRLIQQMAEEVHQRQRKFAVMTVTSAIQVDPDTSLRKSLQTQLHVSDLDSADRRQAALAEAHSFHHIPLAPGLLEFAEREQRWLHGFPNTQLGTGHWNEIGHREAAKLCGESLRPLLESAE